MNLRSFVALFVIFVGGAFALAWIYEPPVSGAYEGLAQDLPMGAHGQMRLTLAESDQKLTGQVDLPPVMTEGGGTLVGTLKKEGLFFVTTDAKGNKMTWRARKSPRSLSGSYWWGELDEKALAKTDALGCWEVSRP